MENHWTNRKKAAKITKNEIKLKIKKNVTKELRKELAVIEENFATELRYYFLVTEKLIKTGKNAEIEDNSKKAKNELKKCKLLW